MHQVKLPGNQGFDRIAIKRNAAGEVIDARIVEVKTHRGTKAKLNDTQSGMQMSENWIRERLEAMRNSNDPTIQRLGNEIEAFHEQKGLPLEKLGEVHDINTRTGTYIRRDAQLNELSSDSIERYLKRLQKRGSTQTRAWATSQLAEYDQIQATGMKEFLDAKPSFGINEPSRSALGPTQRAARIPRAPPREFQNPFHRVPEAETATSVKSMTRQVLRESSEIEAADLIACLEVNTAKRARNVAFANLERVSMGAMARVVECQGVKGVLKRAAVRLAGPIGMAVGVACSVPRNWRATSWPTGVGRRVTAKCASGSAALSAASAVFLPGPRQVRTLELSVARLPGSPFPPARRSGGSLATWADRRREQPSQVRGMTTSMRS